MDRIEHRRDLREERHSRSTGHGLWQEHTGQVEQLEKREERLIFRLVRTLWKMRFSVVRQRRLLNAISIGEGVARGASMVPSDSSGKDVCRFEERDEELGDTF